MRWLVIGILIGVLSASSNVHADQCTALTVDQANRTAALLPVGARILHYCPQCGDAAPSAWEDIRELSIVGSGDQPRSVKINGKVRDLAYTYYWARDQSGRNVALQVGCPARDIQPVLWLRQNDPLRRYKLTLTIEIMGSKANGTRWDPAGDAPDPVIRGELFQGQKHVRDLTCGEQDTYRSTCLNGTIIEANSDFMLSLDLDDWDAIDDDTIGHLDVRLADAIASPGRQIIVRQTIGQIKSAVLTLTPVQ